MSMVMRSAPAAVELLPPTRNAPGGIVNIYQLPATVNLFLYQGDSVNLSVVVSDADGEPFALAGWTVESQIRATFDAPIAAEFEPTIDGSVINLYLDPTQSAGIPIQAVWDVQISQPGVVTTLAAGTVTVTREVTR